MEIVRFNRQPEIDSLFNVALERRNLIPIIGSGFTRGEKACNGMVPSGEDFKSIMIEKICAHSNELSKEDFASEGYKFSEIADEFLSVFLKKSTDRY